MSTVVNVYEFGAEPRAGSVLQTNNFKSRAVKVRARDVFCNHFLSCAQFTTVSLSILTGWHYCAYLPVDNAFLYSNPPVTMCPCHAPMAHKHSRID